MVDRESMSDEPITEEMCIVAPALRVGPEISASGVAALGNRTTTPCARALLSLILGTNETVDNFEIASSRS